MHPRGVMGPIARIFHKLVDPELYAVCHAIISDVEPIAPPTYGGALLCSWPSACLRCESMACGLVNV